MTVRTLDGKSLCEQLADNYKRTLPKNGTGVKWTMDSFSTWVSLLHPEVTVKGGQLWMGNRVNYTMICEVHGEYPAAPHNFRVGRGNQCKYCQELSNSSLVGIRRCKRSTKEERTLAAKHFTECRSYAEVGRILNRPAETIRQWLNPAAADKRREGVSKRVAEDRERHNARVRHYQKNVPHGKANCRLNGSTRDLLRKNTPELVFLDNEWCGVDRRETYRVFSEVLLPRDEREAIQDMYLEAQQLTERTGVEFHVDHIQPLSKGGEHLEKNLQIIPAEENLTKNNKFSLADQAELCKRLFNIK